MNNKSGLKGYKLWKQVPAQVFDKKIVNIMKSLMAPRELNALSIQIQ